MFDMRKAFTTLAVLTSLVGTVHARPVEDFVTPPSSEILRSLPTEVQKGIEDLRASCREFGPKETHQPDITSGDRGLITFTLSGAPAVMVNDQYICGGECLRGANCDNRNSYTIAIFRRTGSTWRKVFDTNVVGDIFLSTDWPKSYEFKVMVLSVFSGNKDCPTRDMKVQDSVVPAWKQSCDAVVRWDGTKFTFTPLKRLSKADAARPRRRGDRITATVLLHPLTAAYGHIAAESQCGGMSAAGESRLLTSNCPAPGAHSTTLPQRAPS
jgi:hypothetical protein